MASPEAGDGSLSPPAPPYNAGDILSDRQPLKQPEHQPNTTSRSGPLSPKNPMAAATSLATTDANHLLSQSPMTYSEHPANTTYRSRPRPTSQKNPTAAATSLAITDATHWLQPAIFNSATMASDPGSQRPTNPNNLPQTTQTELLFSTVENHCNHAQNPKNSVTLTLLAAATGVILLPSTFQSSPPPHSRPQRLAPTSKKFPAPIHTSQQPPPPSTNTNNFFFKTKNPNPNPSHQNQTLAKPKIKSIPIQKTNPQNLSPKSINF
ncbi:hypothetical protein AB3S75_013019 [Citrus x aurantiifolia]